MKKKYIKYTFILYIILNILLLYLLMFGDVVNGSKAWISIFGFSFQPSEFMKIILIVLLSIVAVKYDRYKLKCFILTLIPSVLTFLEPDTGNVIFYFIIFFSTLIYKEPKLDKIVKVVAVLVLLIISFAIFYFLNKELVINILGSSLIYRMDRISSLITKESFQLSRSLINIGSSGLMGSNVYLYIPEETTDFAFAYLIHNIGLLGITIFLTFNLYVNFSILSLANKHCGILSCVSFITIILKFSQESIHELMGLGLFPITGITLPLVSYGGSSVLSFILILSIIFNKGMDKDNS